MEGRDGPKTWVTAETQATPTNYTIRNRETKRQAGPQGRRLLCSGPKGLRLETVGKAKAVGEQGDNSPPPSGGVP